MSDLIERLNEQREVLLRFKLVAGETVTNRVYSELVEAARIAADSMREAAAELARLTAEAERGTGREEALGDAIRDLVAGKITCSDDIPVERRPVHVSARRAFGAVYSRLKADAAEVERLRANDGRYRFLRGWWFDETAPMTVNEAETSDELDAAIDEAIKEAGNG